MPTIKVFYTYEYYSPAVVPIWSGAAPFIAGFQAEKARSAGYAVRIPERSNEGPSRHIFYTVDMDVNVC